jgi:hypothetical protein
MRRGWYHAALGAAVMATATATAASACSPGSPESGTTARQQVISERVSDAAALLAQCALASHVPGVADSARKYSGILPASQQWLRGGQIVLTKDSAAQFNGWYQGHLAGVVLGGRSFDRWGGFAARNGKLPIPVCGAGVSARRLHDQIYAHFPRMMKDNPWGS